MFFTTATTPRWDKSCFYFLKNCGTLLAKYFFTWRLLSQSHVCCLNQKWRQERGLPLNPNASGVLTGGNDYSFLDGRSTPYGVRQQQRILKQRQITNQIITLSAEVDFAIERHKKLQQEEEDKRQHILQSKLKPKGLKLLKKK